MSDLPVNHPPGSSLAGRRVLVVGLGRFGGGIGVTRWLASQGARVTVSDQATEAELAESMEAVANLDVVLHLGGHDQKDLDGAELVVINPAVDKPRSPLFQEIIRRSIPWTTETNLFCERCPARIVGVTGSFGKSTVSAMLAAVLRAWCQKDVTKCTGVHLGGNIGHSLLPELDAIQPTDWVVLEMSSVQLEDLPRIRWVPPVAVINSIHPHHLDRHDGLEGYVNAKLNIACDPLCRSRVFIGKVDPSAETLLPPWWSDHPKRITRIVEPGAQLKLRVPGDHNQANAAVVVAVSRYLGVEDAVILRALASFPGLPDRLEHVRTIADVDYYNDSKSTSPAATLVAVDAVSRPAVVVVGGKTKDVPLAEWARRMAEVARVVVCTGESGPRFAAALRETALTRRCTVYEVATLAEAARRAQHEAAPGEAVLFSPGAPSFDEFANYVERGQRIRDIIKVL